MIITNEMLKFLDDEVEKNRQLSTNGAVPVLVDRFKISEDDAVAIIDAWLQDVREGFDVRHLQS